MMKTLQLESKETNGLAVVFLDGYLNERGGELLEHECQELLRRGLRRLQLDFAGAAMVNSVGISHLLDIIEFAQREELDLRFCRVPEHIVELFDLLGISSKVRVEHL